MGLDDINLTIIKSTFDLLQLGKHKLLNSANTITVTRIIFNYLVISSSSLLSAMQSCSYSCPSCGSHLYYLSLLLCIFEDLYSPIQSSINTEYQLIIMNEFEWKGLNKLQAFQMGVIIGPKENAKVVKNKPTTLGLGK